MPVAYLQALALVTQTTVTTSNIYANDKCWLPVHRRFCEIKSTPLHNPYTHNFSFPPSPLRVSISRWIEFRREHFATVRKESDTHRLLEMGHSLSRPPLTSRLLDHNVIPAAIEPAISIQLGLISGNTYRFLLQK